ncbi:MAG: ribosomal-processing cysteine protease Prp [Lachnospiraceae bacterium]|jgi:hypothetical protein|nr:ribosomal-processing cysteine protease Prp [Lachnospiraceae bacterium]MBQ3792689.1 ribosomal-processing cysteine protease Prp [Lachnospiraceae bacterium]MBR1849346.1 ribosomal-processing cysteine protease Prp [Lachnospiraceae bacterium]MCR5321437.1 ribosomal-processing cysteine protease Prp [Lachnospiraceae bacterium]
MTTITICTTKEDGSYTGFTVFGHAGYDDIGNDIVCAAISMLTINTVNSLEEFCGLVSKVTENEETGFLRVEFPRPLESEKEIVLMQAMCRGCHDLEQQYGKSYCQLKFEEV